MCECEYECEWRYGNVCLVTMVIGGDYLPSSTGAVVVRAARD